MLASQLRLVFREQTNLKRIARLGLIFYSAIQGDRVVSVNRDAGWVQIQNFVWTEDQLEQGVWVRLKKVAFAVRVFKLVATNGDIDWVITNHPDSTVTREGARHQSKVRWQIEDLHGGSNSWSTPPIARPEKRALSGPIWRYYQAWVSLKINALEWGVTLYQAHNRIFKDFLYAQLYAPLVPAYHP